MFRGERRAPLHIRNEFFKSGVHADHVDGTTPKAKRDAALARLASGETELASAIAWSSPKVGTCRRFPAASSPGRRRKMGLYRQMIGRVLRPAPGKINAAVLDHSRRRLPSRFRRGPGDWTLDAGEAGDRATHAARLAGPVVAASSNAAQCGSIRTAGEACRSLRIPPADARPGRSCSATVILALVDRERRHPQQPVSDPHERMRWHAMLTYIAAEARL